MNGSLYKATFRSGRLILIVFAALLFMYMSSIVSLYDPSSAGDMQELLDMIPDGLAQIMGFGGQASGLAGFLGNYFYTMLIFLIPLVYVSVTGHRLIAQRVDSGSITYLLATPNSRMRIAITQGLSFLTGIALLFVFLTGATITLCAGLHPGELDIGEFLALNLLAFLLTCTISSITWFFSCLFSEARYSIAFGTGIPVLLFLMNMAGGASDKLKFLSDLSLYHLFKPQEILYGTSGNLGLAILFSGITLILYGAGVTVFCRKNLVI